MPAWNCSNCLKQISTCTSADPIQFDVTVRIVNCAAHKTVTAKPSRPSTAAPQPPAAAPQPPAAAPQPPAAAPQPPAAAPQPPAAAP